MPSLFISYASEDSAFVDLLFQALKPHFENVWYDKDSLRAGDNLRQEISKGLSKADFGVVVISESFLSKYWTQSELGALAAMETTERKVILPIRWKASMEQIIARDGLLAGRKFIDGDLPLDQIVDELRIATESAIRAVEIERQPPILDQLNTLKRKLAYQQRAELLAENSTEGAQKATAASKEILDYIQRTFSLGDSILNCERRRDNELTVFGPERIMCVMAYRQYFTNSLNKAEFEWLIYRYVPFSHNLDVERQYLKCSRLPWFDETENVIWRLPNQSAEYLTSNQLAESIMSSLLEIITTEVTK